MAVSLVEQAVKISDNTINVEANMAVNSILPDSKDELTLADTENLSVKQ